MNKYFGLLSESDDSIAFFIKAMNYLENINEDMAELNNSCMSLCDIETEIINTKEELIEIKKLLSKALNVPIDNEEKPKKETNEKQSKKKKGKKKKKNKIKDYY